MLDMQRLDILVSKTGDHSREYAKELIKNGHVSVDGKVLTKPSEKVAVDCDVVCCAPSQKYVSRGGYKLEKALDVFGVSLQGRVCLDVGASTGGFTHCMLENGAKKVYAVDTGTEELAEVLRNNPRVVSMEKTNINSLTKADFIESIEFVCVDVAFVSVTKVMNAVFAVLSESGQAVCLIKPQFEAGRENIGKKGLVKDPKIHLKVLENIYDAAAVLGHLPSGVTCSPIKGGTGNVEYLVFFDLAGLKNAGLGKEQFMRQCKEAVKQ